MLIDINILTFEDIDLIISTRIDHINNYDIIFSLSVTSLSRSLIKQNVILEKSMTILAHAQLAISIKHINLSAENNFIFESVKDCSIALFAAVVDFLFHIVLARNDSDQSIYLSSHLQLGSIMNLDVNGYYHLDDAEETHDLALMLLKQIH